MQHLTTLACLSRRRLRSHLGDDVISAYRSLPFEDVITKHNRAGKGLGVQLLKSEAAALEHINSPQFDDSVDGLTLVQQYIQPADSSITRVEFIGREFFYAVKVDTSNGFELCPADVCALEEGFCATDGEARYPFEIMVSRTAPQVNINPQNESCDAG